MEHNNNNNKKKIPQLIDSDKEGDQDDDEHHANYQNQPQTPQQHLANMGLSQFFYNLYLTMWPDSTYLQFIVLTK